MRQWAARSLPASEVTRVLGAGALPIHLVQEWGGIASNRHGGAFNHRAGGGPRGQPLLLFPPLRLLLLQPLLCHLLMLLNCGLEKTLESPLDCKEIQPVHAKGDQSWVFIGKTDAEAETPILWALHAKS